MVSVDKVTEVLILRLAMFQEQFASRLNAMAKECGECAAICSRVGVWMKEIGTFHKNPKERRAWLDNPAARERAREMVRQHNQALDTQRHHINAIRKATDEFRTFEVQLRAHAGKYRAGSEEREYLWTLVAQCAGHVTEGLAMCADLESDVSGASYIRLGRYTGRGHTKKGT